MLVTLLTAACTPSRPSFPPDTATPPEVASTAASASASQASPLTPTHIPAAARILEPYPYTTPIPPPTPTVLDGIYTRDVKFEGTPTPCRRCAPYRAEGGFWTLILDAGAFRVSHSATDFQGVGSFTISGDQLVLFNDPNCHEYAGQYSWALDGRSLVLRAVADECAFGLREKNLAAGVWIKQADEEGHQIDECQPPSMEAAISGHWPTPAGCQ